MSVRSGQSVTVDFTTRVFATGVGTNADSLPAGTLVINGTNNGATVTVTNVSTGIYKAAVTLPTLAVNDIVSLVIAATVSSVTDSAVIWTDTKDVFAGAIPDVAAGGTNGLFIAGTNAATTVTTSFTTNFTGSLTGSVASVSGNVGGNVVGSVGSISGVTFPTNFSALSISVAGKINEVVLVDTLTTYTGNTVQTGDSFARIGANGVGLTNIVLPSGGLANVIAWSVAITGNITGNLSGAVGSVSGNVGGNVTGSVGSVVGAVGSVTGAVGSVTGAVGSVTAGVTVTMNNDKTGYTLTVTPPTAVQNADALLGRNVAGGSSAGRIVSEALYALRNKVTISGSTMTVFLVDDTTTSWTATLTSDAFALPITSVDPS